MFKNKITDNVVAKQTVASFSTINDWALMGNERLWGFWRDPSNVVHVRVIVCLKCANRSYKLNAHDNEDNNYVGSTGALWRGEEGVGWHWTSGSVELISRHRGE